MKIPTEIELTASPWVAGEVSRIWRMVLASWMVSNLFFLAGSAFLPIPGVAWLQAGGLAWLVLFRGIAYLEHQAAKIRLEREREDAGQTNQLEGR